MRTRFTSDSPLFRVGGGESGNRSDAERPTLKAIEEQILPTLRWAIEPANRLDPDVLAASYLALGKTARGEEDVHRLLDVVRKRRGNALSLEGAVLSLGCLRRSEADARLDGRLLDEVRGALFSVFDDDELHARARCFAALAVGLLGDQPHGVADRAGASVVRGLWLRLEEKHPGGEDLPVALLLGLALQPREAVPTAVLDGLKGLALTGRHAGRHFGLLSRSQALVTLARLSDATGAGAFLAVLRGRTGGVELRRAAVVSLGVAAPRLEPGARREAVEALCETYERENDPDVLGLTLISLARLLQADGNDASTALLAQTSADETLLGAVESGRAQVRPFAALALGVAGRGLGPALDAPAASAFRVRSLDALRAGIGDERIAPEARGAWCLGAALLEDEGAIGPLKAIAAKASAPDELRGHACLALGLIGRPSPDVVATLKGALTARSSDVLRRQAATGLGHLGETSAVALLVKDLESGGSDHVLAQVVLALGVIGDVAAVPHLARIVRDPRATDLVRALACAGLGLVGDRESFPSLSRLGVDSNYVALTDAVLEAMSLL
jgi:hypothetical protein